MAQAGHKWRVRVGLSIIRRPTPLLFADLPDTFIKHGVDNPDPPSAPGRVLALDMGARRVGVAISDELRLTVRPLQTLNRSNWKRLLGDVAALCESFDVQSIVIGLPLRLDGSEGDAATAARRHARNFALSLRLPVALHDERLTSRAAEEHLRAAGRARHEVARRVDSEAAAIILRDFLSESVGSESDG